jgi:hypothetical protein
LPDGTEIEHLLVTNPRQKQLMNIFPENFGWPSVEVRRLLQIYFRAFRNITFSASDPGGNYQKNQNHFHIWSIFLTST